MNTVRKRTILAGLVTASIWAASMRAQSFPHFALRDSAITCYVDPTSTGTDSQQRLAYAGEIRDVYERFGHPDFSLQAADPSGYFLQRALACVSIAGSRHVEFMTEIDSSLEFGRAGGPRPIVDQDKLDGLQGYLDLRINSGPGRFAVRLGRQQMMLGSGRMIAMREGTNVPSTFDGGRVTFSIGPSRVDGFYLRPVQDRSGIFNDVPDHTVQFWGVYGGTTLHGQNVELYYLGYDKKSSHFDQGSGHEVRQTFGVRVQKQSSLYLFDLEAILQGGSFGGPSIRAWRYAGQIGKNVTFGNRRQTFLFDADIASGDKSGTNPSLQTFNALFQSGTYSGRAQILGPANTIRIEPSAVLAFSREIKATAGWGWFWRESANDGLYGIAGNLIVPSNGATGKYEGMRPTLQVDWQISKALSAHVNYIYVFNGPFEEASVHGSKSMSFVSTWLTYRF